MQRTRAILGLATVAILFGGWTSSANAQGGKPRQLAPGVMKTVPTDLNPRDLYSRPMPMPRLNSTEFKPLTIPTNETLHGQSQRVIMYRNNIWEYEFSFIPLRQARLEVPSPDGTSIHKNIWYLLFRIRDTGKTLSFKQVKQHPDFEHIKYDLQENEPIAADRKRLFPRFTLEGWVANDNGEGYRKVSYRDEINPVIVEQIRLLEDANQRLLDPHQISKIQFPISSNELDSGVWGVAIWENVNPEIDFVSVYVKGLTNAFRLNRDVSELPNLKTLQLNFWRPGDSVAQSADRIMPGIPLVDSADEQALICERYDLPGPLISGYHVDKDAKRDILVVEVDAEVDLKTFESALTPLLDRAELPPAIIEAFADSGIAIGDSPVVLTVIPGKRWTVQVGDEQYLLALEPQFWTPEFGKIKFIKSLDQIWVYR